VFERYYLRSNVELFLQSTFDNGLKGKLKIAKSRASFEACLIHDSNGKLKKFIPKSFPRTLFEDNLNIKSKNHVL
jgi:hypothetical protein